MVDRTKWQELVVLVSQLGQVPDALLAAHRADGHGRCVGCKLPQSGDQAWPCTLYTLAVAAIEVRANTRARDGAHPAAAGDPAPIRGPLVAVRSDGTPGASRLCTPQRGRA